MPAETKGGLNSESRADARLLGKSHGDDEGGVWDEFGHTANEGGGDLLVADGYFTEWYEWVSGWPESQVAN